VDGLDAFPDQEVASREYRDEPACARLQLQTRYADHGGRTADASDESIALSLLQTSLRMHMQAHLRGRYLKTVRKNSIRHRA